MHLFGTYWLSLLLTLFILNKMMIFFFNDLKNIWIVNNAIAFDTLVAQPEKSKAERYDNNDNLTKIWLKYYKYHDNEDKINIIFSQIC